jgi:hypothetical protein
MQVQRLGTAYAGSTAAPNGLDAQTNRTAQLGGSYHLSWQQDPHTTNLLQVKTGRLSSEAADMQTQSMLVFMLPVHTNNLLLAMALRQPLISSLQCTVCNEVFVDFASLKCSDAPTCTS